MTKNEQRHADFARAYDRLETKAEAYAAEHLAKADDTAAAAWLTAARSTRAKKAIHAKAAGLSS